MTRHRLSLFIYTERSEPQTQVLFIGSATEVKIIQFIHTYIYTHTCTYINLF